MVVSKELRTISMPAGADLSALQYTEVYTSPTAGDGLVITATAATDVPLGILQNKPAASGRAAEVAIGGVTKMVAGGTVDEGDIIMWGTGSKGVVGTTGTTYWQLGVALTPAASGETFEMLIMMQLGIL